LAPETVALMNRNQIGDLPAGILKTQDPVLSNDVDFFPGAELRWGLGYMLNLEPGPNGRSAGTVSWAGLGNLYYWLDPTRRLAGEPVAAIYASPLQRTRESAEIVAARLQLPIEFRDDVIELDFGEWTGSTFDAIRADPRWEAWRTQRSIARIPGGESMREVQK